EGIHYRRVKGLSSAVLSQANDCRTASQLMEHLEKAGGVHDACDDGYLFSARFVAAVAVPLLIVRVQGGLYHLGHIQPLRQARGYLARASKALSHILLPMEREGQKVPCPCVSRLSCRQVVLHPPCDLDRIAGVTVVEELPPRRNLITHNVFSKLTCECCTS